MCQPGPSIEAKGLLDSLVTSSNVLNLELLVGGFI